MGFEGKSKELKEDIIAAAQGDASAKERLSLAGKKGAETRAKNRAIGEVLEEHKNDFEWKKLYESRLSELKKDYPELDEDGTPLPEGWHEEEAAKTADVILKMREKQKKMEKRSVYKTADALQGVTKSKLSPKEDLERQVEEGNSYAKEALKRIKKD